MIGKLDSILAKIRKLRSMPTSEIWYRIRGVIFEWTEFIRYRLNLTSMSDEKFYRTITGLKSQRNGAIQLFHMFEHHQRDRFFTETYDKTTRLKLINANLDCSSWIKQAEAVLTGKVDLLGRQLEIPFSGGWHMDPLVHKAWPRQFYAQVKKNRHVRNWDVKYIWEVNRHQYLIVLGKAYWLTDDERYAEKVVAAIQSWIDENPYCEGVNWTSSLELAVRTISWLWSFFFCKGSKHVTNAFQKTLFKSLYQQASYIEKHLSYYSSPYNHLIGEASALHLIGSLCPMFNSGKRWERLGWSILTETVDKQFHNDGMSVEQASFYHHFTLGFYLQSIFLRRNNNKPIPENVLKKIESALEFSMYLAKPDGTIPMIGDIDNARSLYFDTSHRWDFGSFLSLGAILFKRTDFKCQSSGYCEELLWIAKEDDLKLFRILEKAEPAETSIPCYKSGYFISRDSWNKDANYLCFDCGEIAAGLSEGEIPSAAHGHADGLSFELVVHGKPFIVDSGFYTYFGELNWHKYFRHEEAHNTVIISDHRQAEYCGRLTWRNVKSPKLHCWESGEKYDAVTGSIIYSEGISHIRQMITVKKYFWILYDVVKASHVEDDIHSFLHFAPEVDLSLNHDKREMFASIGQYGLLIKYFCSSEIRVKKGGTNPCDGWNAAGYGMKLPSWCASFLWPKNGSVRSFVMLFIPVNKEIQGIRILDEKRSNISTESELKFLINDRRFSVNFNRYRQIQFSIGNDNFCVDFPTVN